MTAIYCVLMQNRCRMSVVTDDDRVSDDSHILCVGITDVG